MTNDDNYKNEDRMSSILLDGRGEVSKPADLWSEVLPNLWQGGTAYNDDNEYSYRRFGDVRKPDRISLADFDSVYTMYAYANPVGWLVKEFRFAIYDSDMAHFDAEGDLYELVRMAHRDWKNGKRVLIRCQAGLNRSGLVMALVLIRDGYSPEDAIKLIRSERSKVALCNPRFVNWLMLECNPDYWRS